jgi:hypothetical protein
MEVDMKQVEMQQVEMQQVEMRQIIGVARSSQGTPSCRN